MADFDDSEPENKYPNRPKDSAFRQQRLPACQPVLTPYSVLPVFLAVGVAFIPIGIWIFSVADGIIEVKVDYTHCEGTLSINGEDLTGRFDCMEIYKYEGNASCKCSRNLNIPEPGIPVPALFYYGLTNYYQNHRLYAKSRNDKQLRGDLSAQDGCEPYYSGNNKSAPVVPCGALANSLFNDSFTLFFNHPQLKESIEVVVTKNGIAWPSDKEMRFRNPSTDTNLSDAFANTQKPKNWKADILHLDPSVPLNDTENVGLKNEDLIVWMRTAAFPNFRKLYRKVIHEGAFANGLPAGNYTVKIQYNYPVTQFSGTKHFVVTTTSWLGGKNYFLGYVYIIVGAFSLAAGILLLILFLKFGKKTKDLINITTSTPYYE